MLKIKKWVLTKKGNQFEVELPAVRIVCPECNGSGKVLRDGMRGYAYTAEDMEDEEFSHHYRRGDYDVACDCCNGENVILDLDLEKVTKKMKARLRRQERLDQRDRWEAYGESMVGC